MKYSRNILRIVIALLALLVIAGCDDDRFHKAAPGPGNGSNNGKDKDKDDDGDDGKEPDNSLNEIGLYEAFRTQFEAGESIAGFRDDGSGSYEVLFGDKRMRRVSGSEVRVAVCSVGSWPSLTVAQDGEWLADGIGTGIRYVRQDGEEEIVMVMYDGDGLYARLSSGRMFFFHYGGTLEIGCFRFEKALNPELTGDIICQVGDRAVRGYTGGNPVPDELVATVGYRGKGLYHGGVEFQSSVTKLSYAGGVSLQLATSGASRSYSVTLSDRPSIPVLRISTGGRSIPKDQSVKATMAVEDPDMLYSDGTELTLDMEIHGRGNSTWGMPKKPYKIKLAEKRRLFGMSDSKHWVLLANYSDKTLLRNIASFEMARLAGMAWAPLSKPVELYLNGSYEGQYMLTEHVRVASERVEMDVVTASDNSGEALTGGYFLWIDSRSLEQGNQGFWTPRGLPVSFEEPENPTYAQRTYVEKFIKDTELALYNKPFEEYSEVIDIESFIKYFFVHEITKDVDGDMRLSTYMWKPRDGKLGFPCVWDFDIALGNCDYNPSGNGPTGWHIRDCIWFRQLFRNRKFVERVTEAWREYYPKLPQVEATVREWADVIDDAQKRNFQKWQILHQKVWPNYVVKGSYSGELEYMLWFFNERIKWMNTEIEAGRLLKTN